MRYPQLVRMYSTGQRPFMLTWLPGLAQKAVPGERFELPTTFAVAAKDFITQHAARHSRDGEEQARLLGFNPSDLTIIPKGLADRWRDEPGNMRQDCCR